MKKTVFITMVLIAIFGLFFVSCNPKESSKHEYTQEELDEIARQDSLKQLIPADYVFAYTVTLPYSDNWEGLDLKLVADKDTAKLLELFEYDNVADLVAALGTLEGEPPSLYQVGHDVTFYAYNYSTKYEYSGPSTTTSFGHWFNAVGDVTIWANGDQMAFLEKSNDTDLTFFLGMLPGGLAIGDTIKMVEAMKYDTTQVAFFFTVIIGDEPELVYPVTTIAGSKTYEVEAIQNTSYAATDVVIDGAAVTAAIGCEPAVAEFYGVDASDDSLRIEGFTAGDGYWFNAAGDVAAYSADGTAIYVEYDEDTYTLKVGQMPNATTVDQVYTQTIAFVNLTTLKQYNVTVKYKVLENPYPTITQVTAVDTIKFATAADATYATVSTALDSAGIYNAIGCGPSAAKLYGLIETTKLLYVSGYTTDGAGFWYNLAGDVTTWGTANGSVMFFNYIKGTQTINVGQFPDACTTGNTYFCTMAFVNAGKQANIRVEMTIQ